MVIPVCVLDLYVYMCVCVCGVCVDQMFGITKVLYVFERKSLTNAAFIFSKI